MSAAPASTVIERAVSPTAEVHALVGALEAELSGEYEAHQRHGLKIEQIFQPHIRFFLVRVDGRAVACGGIALDDGFAEVKRMYVEPSMRGQGIAQTLLAHLETVAADNGYARLLLETGDTLHAAHKVYERTGFTRCDAFGHYADLPPHTIERSVFMEKRIA